MWFLCQRYNLKAIHNKLAKLKYIIPVVVSMSKIQSESNSQHPQKMWYDWSCCGFYVKDTIWKQFTTGLIVVIFLRKLWFLCQRYNLKAIHNTVTLASVEILVVVSMSKIQSESNSQPTVPSIFYWTRCGFYVKDTIWKQFTTLEWRH